jgi:hypothetical protein
MGFNPPQPFEVESSGSIGAVLSGTLGSVGPVTVAGIPDTFHIDIDKLPKIQLGVDPLTINPVTLHLDPVDLNLRLKEIPNTRAHLPADFTVGLSLLGMELMCVRLCGEAQMITEPYHPNPCEQCRDRDDPAQRPVVRVNATKG